MTARTAKPPTAVEVGQKYFELHHQAHRMVDQAMIAHGTSFARMKVLLRLHQHGDMNQSTLAGLLGFAPRSVTETVDALEREGLVTRTPDPRDRRVRIVGLTAAGHEAYAEARIAKEKVMTAIFGGLDASERASLVALFDKIKTNLPAGEQK